jgi:alpha-ketoglutarate-dependent taurine dioxygenase
VKADGTLRSGDHDDVMKVLKGNMFWHADSTYMPVQAKGAVFSAEIVPEEGGETGWADMRAAYDALPPAMKDTIAPMSAHHSLRYSQAKLGHKPREGSEYSGYGFHDGPVPLRPLVKTHPETGRKSLLIGRHAPQHSRHHRAAVGVSAFRSSCASPARARAPYHHRWTAGEAVIWDNRCLLHRAMPWDMTKPRVMWHSRIAGDPASEAAAS